MRFLLKGLDAIPIKFDPTSFSLSTQVEDFIFGGDGRDSK